ncbi:ATPase [Crocinitomicaceae bacterium]|nr:ATPase [Crocinitomicaceae bacterium]
MLIVVESGSTKADWMILHNGSETISNTKGFNPYFHSKSDILEALKANDVLDAVKDDVQQLHFYGAGCSSPELNAIIESGLSPFFRNAIITVDHDLNASAFACYNGEPEIACILGTGSNSCFFDGESMREEVPALGHLLGDEGSGNYFGKRMLADYLYKRLPRTMHDTFEDMGLTKASIVERVYQKPDANVFIASLMPVLIDNKDLPYSQELIRKGFQEFIDVHVKCFEEYKTCEVNFVGSISDLLQEELHAVCKDNGIRIGRIVRRPLQNLVNYHVKLLEKA